MRVSLPTQVLLEAAGHVASVAANKSPKPILECLALRADATTGLSLEATDLDVGIRYHIADVEVSEPGALVIPAARFLSIVREIDEETTTLFEKDGGLAVDSGRSHFQVRGESIDEFPQLPFFPEEGATTINADLVRNMIRRTAFATAKEAGRFALHGVQFQITGSTIQMVATDGRRLARATGDLGKKCDDVQAIVGPKGLHMLERVSGESSDIELAIADRQALFRVGGALIISRLIDGSFPSLDGVIPAKSDHEFRSTASELSSGLRRASLLTTRDALSVELHIEPQSLVIRSRARDVGEAKVEVPVQYDGQPQTVGFNPVFLQDALKVMEPGSEVRFEFTNAKSPGLLSDHENYTYVIMPIALE